MLQSTLPYIAFQGVFRFPAANFLLSPVALIARIYFHSAMTQKQSLFQTGTEFTLSAILSWGSKLCGLKEEFSAAARMVDIVSCGVELSDATDALLSQISHIFTYTLYGTSFETAMQKQLSKSSSYDFQRLSQLARRFFLALAQFHCALSGQGSELLLFRNIGYLQRRFKVRPKCGQLMHYLLPTENNVTQATSELLRRVYEKVHVSHLEWAQMKISKAADVALKFVGWRTQEPEGSEEEEVPPLENPICWTATPRLC